jgi:hypothetical protein
MKGLKLLSMWTAVALVIISLAILFSGNIQAGFLLYEVTALIYCIVELLVGTMYLEREGWIFLEEELWGDFEKLRVKLGDLDDNLRSLRHWGLFSLYFLY